MHGSAATHAIRCTDANTVIFFPAADTIAFSEGGAEVARFDSSGNLGIGTTSPTTRLDVSGQARFSSGATASAAILTSTNAGGTALNIQNSGTVNSLLGGYNSIVGSGNATDVMLSATQGILAFGTGASSTERMRITNAGDVGIGTTSPSNQLHVARAGSTYIRVSSTDVGSGTGLWTTNSTNAYLIGAGAASGGSGLEFRDVTNSTTRMILDSSGNLLVGTTSTSVQKIRVDGTQGGIFVTNDDLNHYAYLALSKSSSSATHYVLGILNSAGTTVGAVTHNNTNTTYGTSSDYRLKENVVPMTGALAKVQSLKPCTYTWKADGSDGQGFIAHELQEVFPDAVTGEKDAVNEDGSIKPQGIDTSFLVATLTASIQELKAIVDAQAARIAVLESK